MTGLTTRACVRVHKHATLDAPAVNMLSSVSFSDSCLYCVTAEGTCSRRVSLTKSLASCLVKHARAPCRGTTQVARRQAGSNLAEL